MLSESAISFLKRLLDAPGPSGFESRPARVWRQEAADFAADVRGDVAGNSLAAAGPADGPVILLAGHIDEIGVIITYIDDDGFVYVQPIGGWDAQVLVGQRIRFASERGDVIGVVGKRPIHVMTKSDRETASKISDLWVDIGARTRQEAEDRLTVGDAGVIDAAAVDLPNARIVSRSIDNRIGAFVVLEALRRYATRPGAARVVAVATTQEEIASLGGGAHVSAASVNARMAIVVDVTVATDHPGMDKKEIGDHRLGGGPVLARGAIISPVVFRLLRDAAVAADIPYTVHGVGRHTGTDADSIHVAREGVATGLVSVPNRYMHSPNEMVSLEDLDRAAELIAAACRSVTHQTDFTAR